MDAEAAAAPELDAWEWGLVSHVMDDEGMALLTDRDLGERIISADRLCIGIVEWADGAAEAEMLRPEAVAQRARRWSDVERWALMIRARAEATRSRPARPASE